jgi:hypothetical protein
MQSHTQSHSDFLDLQTIDLCVFLKSYDLF